MGAGRSLAAAAWPTTVGAGGAACGDVGVGCGTDSLDSGAVGVGAAMNGIGGVRGPSTGGGVCFSSCAIGRGGLLAVAARRAGDPATGSPATGGDVAGRAGGGAGSTSWR